MRIIENVSLREKELWAELLIDLLVAAYYYPRAISLMTEGTAAMAGREMAGLVASTIVFAIVAGIVLFGTIHYHGETEKADERDFRFEISSNRVAYWSLNFFLVLILSLLTINEFASRPMPGAFILEAGPLGVGQLILLAIFLASITRVTTQLFHYRRSV
ncbi:MAG: hypothetical protein R3F41_06040 [Gammaproteobacteria bacterium]|nr:hypothetical protein [Pseudomonadales bacterium]MCP5348475.1 hypothetical protein [Pseudomonadales bacterium]